MRTSLWVVALLIGALALTNPADADITPPIDFNISIGSIPAEYPYDADITATFKVYGETGGYLRKLQVMDARDFYQTSGGVAADDDLNGDVSTNWGEVTLTLTDPDHYDIRLDSFLLCQYDDPFSTELILNEEKYPDLFVKIWNDATVAEYSYWDLFDGNPLTLVASPELPVLADSKIKIQWSYPYNLAIDDIVYAVVPEPATLVTWVLGLAVGLVGYRRYRRTRV